MKISLNWLREYVDIPWSPGELGDRLTAVGIEVEGIEDQAAVFNGFVVGGVRECAKHPKADRLTVCQVDVGSEILQIVCGAPNVAKGQKVVVGLIGATVPHDQHDPEGRPFTLTNVKLRGVESHGMICSAKELGLGEDGDGILVLDNAAPVGTAISEYLNRNDVILDVGVTPNRADCLSHIGIAREVAMLTGGIIRYPKSDPKESPPPSGEMLAVSIGDAGLCPRYAARVLSGIAPQSSPKWMQDRLSSVGMRPINAVVDITNYVMLEYGQPLHAFDLSKIRGARIDVRQTGSESTFTTLDGKQRHLTSDTLLICDGTGPVAVAGVMGGANSEIGESTTTIVIESANFLPSSIRRTARSFGLSTEASYRFERGVDPELPVVAANRASMLLQELTGAVVHAGALDAYPGRKPAQSISFRVDGTNQILGTNIAESDMIACLQKGGFVIRDRSGHSLAVQAPSYRVDVSQEIDLVEEVARIYGYDNIETKTKAAIDFSVKAADRSPEDEIRSVLVGFGYNEIMTLSLHKESTAKLTSGAVTRVLNPVSAEMQVLRNSLIPGGLDVIRSNVFRSRNTLRLFEIGVVFRVSGEGTPLKAADVVEELKLTMYLVGSRLPAAFDMKSSQVDLFDLKGEVEALLKRLYLDKYRFIPYDGQNPLTEQAVNVELYERDGDPPTLAGWVGRISGDFASRFDVEVPVFACELLVSRLGTGLSAERKLRPLPKFPSVQRDLAFVVEDVVTHSMLWSTIRDAAGPLLDDIALFDVFAGSQAGEGKKSLAYALTFRSDEATLTDAEVDRAVQAIITAAASNHGARLRS